MIKKFFFQVSFDNNMRKFATNAAKFLKESGLQGAN